MKNTEDVVSLLFLDIMDLARKETDVPRFKTLQRGSANRGDLTDENRTEDARQRLKKLVFPLGVNRGIVLLLLLFAGLVSLFTAPKLFYSTYDCTSLTEGNCTGALAAMWQGVSGSIAIAAVYTIVVILGVRAFLHHRVKQTHKWFVNRSCKPRVVTLADILWAVILLPASVICVFAWIAPRDFIPFLEGFAVMPMHAVMSVFFFR